MSKLHEEITFDPKGCSAILMKQDEKTEIEREEMDHIFMREALLLAEQAGAEGEVPVGAVAVLNGEIIARAWNRVESRKNGTAHAEMLVMNEAAERIGDWRLDGVSIYVTKEPCAMCAGAMVNTRIARVVYGMADPRSGCAGSALNVTGFPGMLHRVEVCGGIMDEECREIMRGFFRGVRQKKG